MPSNLWQFTFNRTDAENANSINNTKQYTLPTLTSPSWRNYNSITGTGGGSVVNILNGYLWTNSKKRASDHGRDEAPYIILKERRVKANSLVAQAQYSAGAIADSVKAAEVKLGLRSNSSLRSPTAVGKEIKSLLAKAPRLLSKVTEKLGLGSNLIKSESLQSFLNSQLNFIEDGDPSFLSKDYLSWYRGLYITEPTGWQFVLPYFEDYSQAANNNWGGGSSTGGGNFFTKEASGLAKAAGASAADTIGGLAGTGSYVETSQFYQYAQSGDSVTIRFPLINTGAATYDDIVNNWQFIYLLLYNNKPERVNRNLIEPPPIYEATIPGVKYMPFSYIQNLSITYKGARRTMKIQVPVAISNNTLGPTNTNVDFETIIPEAYDVSITLAGLVTDSKNFMYSLIENQSVIVKDIADRPTATPTFKTFQ